jgi:uncharacterized protein HemY
MTSAFDIDPRPLGLHLRAVDEHWREPSNSRALGVAEAVSAYTRRQQQEAQALFSLAMRQRRQSHEYRQWAREYAEKGDPEKAERWQAEADKYLRNARWHLARARSKGL